MLQHETTEGDEMQAFDRLRQPLVVADQAPEAALPGAGALGHPTMRQEDETLLGFLQLDHMEFEAMLGGSLRHHLAGVPLIDIPQLDVLASGLLDRLRQDTDLGPILFVGWRDMQGQEVSKGIDCQVELRSFLPLVPVVAGARPALGAALQGLLSKMAAESWGLRPWASRNRRRKSSTMAAKQPAWSQCWVCW